MSDLLQEQVEAIRHEARAGIAGKAIEMGKLICSVANALLQSDCSV